jgi:glutathione S-transferase
MEAVSQDSLILYTYFRSSTAWRVRIVLNYKQIPHVFKFVHLVKGDQKSEEYKNINPNAVIILII